MLPVRSSVALRGLILLSVAAPLLARATPASADIRVEHPRIHWDPALRDTLRDELPADPDFVRMQAWVDGRIERQDAAPMLDGNYPDVLVAAAAFVATVLPDATQYSDEARAYLADLAARSPDPEGNLTATRNQLHAMALGYDWLHDVLDADERTALQDAIVAFTLALDDDASTGNYVSGPSRWANVVSLAGAIAIDGDDTRLEDTLATVADRWRDGYNPVLEAVGEGGGHHMAWMYGPAYSDFEAPSMWRTATDDGETWVPDFSRDAAYFHIYGANGQRRVPEMGDCFGNTIQANAMGQIATSAGVFDNPHAEAFYRELEVLEDPPQLEPMYLWRRLVTRAGAPEPEAIDTLPLSRRFEGAGFFVVRDDWNRADATTVVFKASPFYSSGHHQRDEGSFVVDYRGPLLVDAGVYDGSGSDDHYRNFYSRSVAHNTLLVQWPDEEMRPGGYVPDGGQQVRIAEAQDLDGMQGDFRLNGMVGHSDADVCAWARTDTADTYVADKLTAYTRDLLVVRRPGGALHPAIFVVDRATLPEARPASIAWHLAQNAVVDGKAIFAEAPDLAPGTPGGRVALHVLQPKQATLQSFTGDDRWLVGDTSHPPTDEADLLTPYWGRVEVSPPEPRVDPVWSTLVRVGDEDLRDDPLLPVDIGGAGWVGTRLGDTLFAIASPDTEEIELPPAAALVDGCVAGLAPGATVKILVGSIDEPVEIVANEDGLAVFEPIPSGGSESGSASGGADTSGGSAEGGATATDTGTGASSDTDGDTAGANDDGGGCGCTADRGGAGGRGAGWWMLVLATALRRRQSAT